MRLLIFLSTAVLMVGNVLASARAPLPLRTGIEPAQQPVKARRLAVRGFPGGRRESFVMSSFSWPAGQDGREWVHRVELLVPDHPQPGPALLVINNGVAAAGGGRPASLATDLPIDTLETLAGTLGMAVVSIADVPPQAMQLPGDPVERTEDDLVAASWKRLLDDPATHARWPLQVPMTMAAVRALDFADQHLPVAMRPSYVATGASKRGWATWLLPLVDARVSHIVPFVMEMNWEVLAPHIRQIYGGRWPIALQPYVQHGVTGAIGTDSFRQLMQIIDPYRFLGTLAGDRLALPKLLVNASGDDFFPPDASEAYLGALPGPTAVRVAPNSSHGGIRQYVLPTLLPALRRWRAGDALPELHTTWLPEGNHFQVEFGPERPQKATLWQAHNQQSRDFRYACDVRYVGQPVVLPAQGALRVDLVIPDQGWSASFVEFQYSDGTVLTTPVRVLPHSRYPAQPPPEGEGGCLLAPEGEISGPPLP